jgi:hypothetical protein
MARGRCPPQGDAVPVIQRWILTLFPLRHSKSTFCGLHRAIAVTVAPVGTGREHHVAQSDIRRLRFSYKSVR